MNQTFKKYERLNSKTTISELYQSGKHINAYPIKIVWKKDQFDDPATVKVVLSVPKRRFKKAVVRNRIKRLLKEAYRKNKTELINELNKRELNISMFVIYHGKEIPNYKEVEEKIILLLRRLIQNTANT